MPPTSVIVGIAQVLVPFVGQYLVSKGVIPASTWTDIGTIVIALGGAGWSAATTTVSSSNPPAK